MNTAKYSFGFAFLLTISAAPAIQAVSLDPGDVVGPSVGAFPSGTSVASDVVGFAIGSSLVGSIFTLVLEDDPTNPFSGLTFVYGITANEGLSALHIPGFEGHQVNYTVDALLNAPLEAERSVDGNQISFAFSPLVLSSAFLVLQTSAQDYTSLTASVEDTGSASPSILAPVPAPSSIPDAGATSLLLGLAAMGMLGFRRAQRS